MKNAKKEDTSVNAQRILLAYLLDKNKWFKKVAEVLSPEDFVDDFYRQVALLFWEQMEQTGEANPAQIMDYFEDEEEHKKVAELFVSPIRTKLGLEEQEKAINDAVIKIKKKVWRKRLQMSRIFQNFKILFKSRKAYRKYTLR